MKEIQTWLIGVVMIALITIGAGTLLSDFAGEEVYVPGQQQGRNLTTRVNDYIGEFEAVAEEESGSIGFLGLAGLAKLVILDAPIYSINVIAEMAGWGGLPSEAVTLARVAFWITAIVVAILILRGVKS